MRKLFTILLLVLSFSSFATNYYFSNTGNDGNAGTIGSPWATIAKFNSVFASRAPGDFMLFNRGDVFYGSMIISRSGTPGSPITIGAYGSGANPIITGFTTVSAWTNLGSNIWESTAAVSTLATCNMVSINGVNVTMGRYPNTGFFTFQSHSDTTSITSSSLNSGVTNWTGAQVVIRIIRDVSDRGTITSASGGTINFSGVTNTPNDGWGFFIQNDVRTLDAQNEWYYNPSTKKIRVYSTSSPTNVQAASVSELVVNSSRNYITFDNINFTGSNLSAIHLTASHDITVSNCNLSFTGQDGIQGDGITYNVTTSNNTLTDCSNAAIASYDGAPDVNWIITGNTTLRVGLNLGMRQTRTFGAIHSIGNDCLIQYNNTDSSGYSGIQFINNRVRVLNNFVNHSCMALDDGAGIYTNGTGTGKVISGNIVLNSTGNSEGTNRTGEWFGSGIYLDDNSVFDTVVNNTCANNSATGILLHNAANNYVRNNTCYNNYNPVGTGIARGAIFMEADAGSATPFRNNKINANIFFAKELQQYSLFYWNQISAADAKLYGTSDSNYFAKAIDTNQCIRTFLGSITTYYNLRQWKTFSVQDAHSNISAVAVTNLNQLRFEYNATNIAANVNLGGSNYKDVKNASYSGTITLQPYTSLVLINTGSLITPTITWNNPAAITYGTALSGTQLNATSGGVPGTFVYTPASGTVLNAGTQTLNVTFTPTDQSTYSTATKSVQIVVNQAPATLAYSNMTQAYTGSPLQPTITTSPAGLTVINTTYNGVGAIPVNAGSYAVVSGLANPNYTAPTISGTFTITKATATLTVSNLAQVYNGSQKPVTVTTSPAGLSGVSVTYNGSSTPPTNAGSYAIVATLTNPNYTATTVNTTLVIAKATPTVSWSNPSPITYNTPLSGTQLNATASVAGTFTYTPPSGTILNAGTQTLSVNFTPTDATNYNSVNNTTVQIVVNKATATISLSNLAQIYDGTQKSAIATTSPAGLNVVTITYNGSSTAPTNAGSYAVVASLSNSNYTASNASGTLVISKATATITVTNTNQTYNGSPKSVTTSTVPAGLTVISVTYNGSSTSPTNAGSYAVVASLSNANYQASNVNTTLIINKATPIVTWSNPAAITYGTALSGTQLNATANVAGNFVYTPPSGTILSAGSQTLIADFTPTDGANYNSVNGTTVNLTVNKATATITLSNLNQTYTGSPLPVTATTSPAGLTVISITYNGSGTAPTNVGSYAIVATLTNSNYTATNASGTLVISKATATLSLSNLNQTYDGTQKTVTVTTAPAGLTVVSITYNGSATAPTNAGSYAIIASLSNANYQASNVSGTLVIAKATPTISWSNPAAITYGTALSGTQLNATSGGVAGTFTYTPPSGTILNAGTQILSVNFAPTDATNYNSVNGTSVSIVVNKATATITLSNLNQTYDGNPKPVTVTTNPVGLGVITTTYNGSGTAPSAVGSYTVNSSLSNTNYTATPATGTLVISTNPANIVITNINQTYTGSPLPVTVTTSPPSLAYTITYNGSATVPTNAGTYTVIATLDSPNSGADTATYIIAKANPVITWANPSAITYGTALSGTQLNATASVAGVFTYTPASGTILNAGTQILSVGFVPTDAANYNSIPVTTVSLVVNKAVATITLSNLNQTYDGNPKPVTVTTSPASLGVITVLYDDAATVPSAVGSYGVAASLNNSNYTATPVTGTLVISTASATVTITNTNQTYTGSPLPVTVTTNPAGLSNTVTYDGSATIPTIAGSYAVVATINDGVHTGSNTATLVINKATPVVSWSNPVAITYGTALSGTQLNATASVAGTFTYTPPSGSILNAGTQILSVNFVPTDATNYNSVTGTTVSIVVNKAAATLTLSNLNQSYDGNPKPVTVTSSPVGLTVISVTYDGSSTVPSAVGSYAVNATLNNSNYTATPATGTLVISTTTAGISISNLNQVYTGSDLPVTVTTNPSGLTHTVTYNGSSTVAVNAGSYTVIATITDGTYTGADTQTLVISKATPVITWPNPTSITYGTALSGTQLNASTPVAGTFTYLPVSGTVLNAGTQNLATTFTPTDGSNYNSVNKIVSITVNQATAGLSLSNLLQTYNGTPKPVIVTSTPAGLSGITILYNGSATPPTNAGSYAITVSLSNTNYTATPINGTLVIAKASAILSWSIPAPIVFGTALSSVQLNATSNIPGTFSYSPPAGTILNPGVTGMVATFTPTDTVNYNTGTISVPMNVYGSPFILFWIEHGGTWFENLPNQ